MVRNQEIDVKEKTTLSEYCFISAVAVFLIYCIYTIQNIFGTL